MKKPEIIVNSPKCEDFHRHIALKEIKVAESWNPPRTRRDLRNTMSLNAEGHTCALGIF